MITRRLVVIENGPVPHDFVVNEARCDRCVHWEPMPEGLGICDRIARGQTEAATAVAFIAAEAREGARVDLFTRASHGCGLYERAP